VSQQINLYQPIFRKQKRKFSAVAMLQAAGLVAAGIALMAGFALWQTASLRAELARAETQHAAVERKLAEVQQRFPDAVPPRPITEEIARLEQELAAKQRIRQVLAGGAFGNTQGFSEYLAALARQSVPGVWLTGFDIVGAAEQVSLAGRAINAELVPRYLQRLTAEQRLNGVEFRTFVMERDDQPQSPITIAFRAQTGPSGPTPARTQTALAGGKPQ
jgi:hypothetical protein